MLQKFIYFLLDLLQVDQASAARDFKNTKLKNHFKLIFNNQYLKRPPRLAGQLNARVRQEKILLL